MANEQPGTPITVIYHADCLDGFGAAYAAACQLGPSSHFRPMHHGQPWEMAEIAGHRVFILDFSFPRETLESMAAIAASVTQIDHHGTARKPWSDLLTCDENGLESYQHDKLPLKLIFDLNKSGARLGWEYFHQGKPLPLALQHIEDQDLWRFALPGTRAFCHALRLQPFDLAHWSALLAEIETTESVRYGEMLLAGRAIEHFFNKEIDLLANSRLVMPARLRGEPVDALQAVRHGQPVINSENQSWHALSGVAINANGLFASELGNRLAEKTGGFALIWQLAGDGDAKVSLRSKGSLDVARIASRYNGGGHPNAAGFRLPLAQFVTEILGQP